jgi:dTDP-glucose pyrophosphorylase
MKYIDDLLVQPHEALLDVLKKIDLGSRGVAIVVGEHKKLLGIITDGDIRRFILARGDLSSTIEPIYNKAPKYGLNHQSAEQFKDFMLTHEIDVLPVLNEFMQVVDAIFLNDFLCVEAGALAHRSNALKDVPVVIMAGGAGTRLYPYTKILPKPLMPMGDKPISEHIIERFLRYGCEQFYFSVNYKANMIKAYYADLDKDYQIQYIQEDEPLGTAGSLYLLKDKIDKTFFVVNCDIIINIDYQKLYEFHKKMGNKITLVGALKNYQIPYGVMEVSEADNRLAKLVEKPVYNFLTNTGMYILEPQVLGFLPENKFYHITHLLEEMLKSGEKIAVYPVHGDCWLDMGQLEEMQDMMHKLNIS